MPLHPSEKDRISHLLRDLQREMLSAILEARMRCSTDELASISEETAADTIYTIDKVAESAVRDWFSKHWPDELPIEIVMEGLENEPPLTFPRRLRPRAYRSQMHHRPDRWHTRNHV